MMGTLTSALLSFDAEAFSPGLLGDCERMLLVKGEPGCAISLDCYSTVAGEVWTWSIWTAKGDLAYRAARAKATRSEAIDYLESYLRRL